jgi:membrane protease YdiL (CAAX protease family)
MFKNICKSIAWIAVYLVASFVGTLFAMIGYIISHSETNIASEEFLEMCITESIAPGALITGLICVIIFCIYKVVRKHPFDLQSINWRKIIFCFACGIGFNVIISYAITILAPGLPESMVQSATDATSFLEGGSTSPWLLIFSACLLTPIVEEIIFRYGINGTLSRSNVLLAHIVSSLLFGLFHGNVIQGIYTGLFGFVLALFFTNGQNLWYPIAAHMGMNMTSVLIVCVPEVYAGFILIGSGVVGLIVAICMVTTCGDVKTLFVNYSAIE